MNEHVFRTTHLSLAVGIHATRRLEFVGCERLSDRQCAFVFADPHSQASEIEGKFEAGEIVADVNEIISSLRFLKRRVNEALGRLVY